MFIVELQTNIKLFQGKVTRPKKGKEKNRKIKGKLQKLKIKERKNREKLQKLKIKGNAKIGKIKGKLQNKKNRRKIP